MFAKMQTMLGDNARALLSGDTDAIAARCHYPMVVHASGRVVPFNSAADYATTLRHVAAKMRADHPLIDIIARLRTMDVPRDGRFRAWARLTYVVAHGTPPPATDVTYFCRLTDGQIKVEMVEMDCARLPDQPIRGHAA